ncbi:hypothetical protein M8494_18510 [Serratia ureilytica]
MQIKMSQRKPGERRAAAAHARSPAGNSRWLPRPFGRIIGLVFAAKRRGICPTNPPAGITLRFFHRAIYD